ncbi:MAG: laccase domain-containing protein [Clostridia bacterium]|nr:laccase domain-containing protein [Clostridia bacterium]
MLKRNEKNGVIYYTSELLAAHNVRHAFFSRAHGVSAGVFDSLNVSFSRKDENSAFDSAENVKENFKIALGTLGISPENAVMAHQVHFDTVLEAKESDGGKGTVPDDEMPECDGLILRKNTKNVGAVCVKTADCVPIILADIKKGDVCAVHAGWKGTSLGIAPKAALLLSGGKPENVICAIGPCICVKCYETGEKFKENFASVFAEKGVTDEEIEKCKLFSYEYGKMHTDLAAINGLLLQKSGVPSENMDFGGLCSCCYCENGGEIFFSHRRQRGFSGTFLSVAAK